MDAAAKWLAAEKDLEALLGDIEAKAEAEEAYEAEKGNAGDFNLEAKLRELELALTYAHNSLQEKGVVEKQIAHVSTTTAPMEVYGVTGEQMSKIKEASKDLTKEQADIQQRKEALTSAIDTAYAKEFGLDRRARVREHLKELLKKNAQEDQKANLSATASTFEEEKKQQKEEEEARKRQKKQQKQEQEIARQIALLKAPHKDWPKLMRRRQDPNQERGIARQTKKNKKEKKVDPYVDEFEEDSLSSPDEKRLQKYLVTLREFIRKKGVTAKTRVMIDDVLCARRERKRLQAGTNTTSMTSAENDMAKREKWRLEISQKVANHIGEFVECHETIYNDTGEVVEVRWPGYTYEASIIKNNLLAESKWWEKETINPDEEASRTFKRNVKHEVCIRQAGIFDSPEVCKSSTSAKQPYKHTTIKVSDFILAPFTGPKHIGPILGPWDYVAPTKQPCVKRKTWMEEYGPHTLPPPDSNKLSYEHKLQYQVWNYHKYMSQGITFNFPMLEDAQKHHQIEQKLAEDHDEYYYHSSKTHSGQPKSDDEFFFLDVRGNRGEYVSPGLFALAFFTLALIGTKKFSSLQAHVQRLQKPLLISQEVAVSVSASDVSRLLRDGLNEVSC